MTAMGWPPRILYREHFDPVMNASERRSYYAGLYDDTVVYGHTELLRRMME